MFEDISYQSKFDPLFVSVHFMKLIESFWRCIINSNMELTSQKKQDSE